MTNRLAPLTKLNRTTWVVLGVVLLGGVGVVDYVSGIEYSVSLFYVLPIALVAWPTNVRAGTMMAVASAGVWLASDILASHPVSNPMVYLWNTLIRFGFFMLAAFFLQTIRTLERERVLARTDYVTGAANTRFFQDVAQREIDRAARSGLSITLAYLDLDNFKLVNDSLGHQTGDEVLCVVADTLQHHLRRTDVVARIGGDEFAVLLPETGLEEARVVVSKTLRWLLDEMQARSWPVTFSVGVVIFTQAPASVEEILHQADETMYLVKNGSKNDVRYRVWPARRP